MNTERISELLRSGDFAQAGGIAAVASVNPESDDRKVLVLLRAPGVTTVAPLDIDEAKNFIASMQVAIEVAEGSIAIDEANRRVGAINDNGGDTSIIRAAAKHGLN